MSIYSYTSYGCTFPKSAVSKDPHEYFFGSRFTVREHEDGDWGVEFDGDTTYSDDVLEDLIDFFGKPLDKVDGLTLYLWYSTDCDGHYECNLKIEDGKCSFKESEMVMVERPMSECPIKIDWGTKEHRERIAKESYDKLHKTKWDGDKIAEPIHLFPELSDWHIGDRPCSRWYPAGTPVAEVLATIADFESRE